MAFVRRQLRTHCTSYCRCNEMSYDEQCELIVFDYEYWQWYHRKRLTPSRGVIFRFPNGCPQSFGLGPSTLYELSFKISAILIENFVRKTFSRGVSPALFNFTTDNSFWRNVPLSKITDFLLPWSLSVTTP